MIESYNSLQHKAVFKTEGCLLMTVLLLNFQTTANEIIPPMPPSSTQRERERESFNKSMHLLC